MDITHLPIDQLDLDLENPRIGRLMEMYQGTLSEDQIALALGSGDTTTEGETYATFRNLKEAIRAHGGLIQAIIVNRQTNGRMVVIEGNTRLRIYREFHEKNQDGHDWSTIPAVVHDDLSEQEIASIRLQAHLVGPRPWDAYSKARYLDHLCNSQHLTMTQVIEICGGKRQQIDDYIHAYQDMERYYRPLLDSNADFDTTRFSAFVELQRPNVQEALFIEHTKQDFSQWVIDSRLHPLNTVRQLPRILKNDQAKAVFLTEGAAEAIKLLDAGEPETNLEDATLLDLAKCLSRKVGILPFETMQRLKDHPDSEEYACLDDARTNLNNLFEMLSQ